MVVVDKKHIYYTFYHNAISSINFVDLFIYYRDQIVNTGPSIGSFSYLNNVVIVINTACFIDLIIRI